MSINNPFSIQDYYSPEYFCDREKEFKKLINAFYNNRNITLLSIRRLGKTGLIKHLFYNLKNEKKVKCLYIDILKTQNLSDFVKEFSNKILEDEQQNSNWFNKVSKLISGLQANISFSETDGSPVLQLSYRTHEQNQKSLESIFNYLSEQKEEYLIAFDEFQQISEYPEKNIEAIIRTQIQHQHKDKFIFSGSGKHILINMFTDYGRPFYQSTELLQLERIDINSYADFIEKHLQNGNIEMEKNLIKDVIKDLDSHTFYVQYFFNRLYEIKPKKVEEEDVRKLLHSILLEKEYIFINYRNILSKIQFQLLEAIAKEETLESPNSSEFIKKYNFASASTINTSLHSLLDKEMIYRENKAYKVYDVFLSKWLKDIY